MTSQTIEPILNIENLSKSFKSIQALKNISLKIFQNEIFGLLGPDGAGKSTLIYIATGLLGTKKGSVKLLGNDMLKNAEKIKTSIGILPQGLGMSLAHELSVEENINYFAEINHVPAKDREERKKELLDVTNLAEFKSRPVKNLSGGMKQKLGICCTLIHSPEVIFLDEPTTGVDPISRRDIWRLINNIVKEKKTTIFLTTSYMDEAERCHRIALLHKGEILALGNVNQLTQQLDGKLLEIYTDNQQKTFNILKNMKEIKIIYQTGNKLNAILKPSQNEIARIENYAADNNLKIKHIYEGKPALLDIFLSKIMKESSSINNEALEEFFKIKSEKNIFSKNTLDTMIEVKNIYKYFGKFAAVKNISFSVKKGEIFGFLGPNGAGKTTTVKMLCGLFGPSSGSGKINNFDITKDQINIKKTIGYMSQKFSLYRDLKVGENIELYAGIYNIPTRELKRRKNLILQIADLEEKENAITGSLPIGIKQRLALGCAIIHKPEVVFLDEPTSGVDPIARRLFWDIIILLSRKMNITVLVTTHYMDEAEYCDRLSLMHQGELIAIDSPNNLKNNVCAQIGSLLEIFIDLPFEAMDILSRLFTFCNIFGNTIHIYTKQPDKDKITIKSILEEKNIKLVDIRTRIMPFEDVFVYFCEKACKPEDSMDNN